jgi:hypothetical protein
MAAGPRRAACGHEPQGLNYEESGAQKSKLIIMTIVDNCASKSFSKSMQKQMSVDLDLRHHYIPGPAG